MTDVKMLEAAATAAGYEWRGKSSLRGEDGETLYEITDRKYGCSFWNPLDDGDDALRLAVTCRIFDLNKAVVDAGLSLNGKDDFAIVRLAIVKTAAGIGKK